MSGVDQPWNRRHWFSAFRCRSARPDPVVMI